MHESVNIYQTPQMDSHQGKKKAHVKIIPLYVPIFSLSGILWVMSKNCQ